MVPDAFFAAVLAPVGLIILVNAVAFVMVVRQLHKVTRRRGSTFSEASIEKKKNVSMQVRGAFAVFVLLGLTWSMAGKHKTIKLKKLMIGLPLFELTF